MAYAHVGICMEKDYMWYRTRQCWHLIGLYASLVMSGAYRAEFKDGKMCMLPNQLEKR